MTPETLSILEAAADRLEALHRRGRIKQHVGSIPNNRVAKWICGRCFGAILHEMLYQKTFIAPLGTSLPQPSRFSFTHGILMLDRVLSEGVHYRKTLQSEDYFHLSEIGNKLEKYLSDHCGAPFKCFTSDIWDSGTTPAEVLRKAIGLNR